VNRLLRVFHACLPIITVVAVLMPVTPLAADAQQATKPSRIGWLAVSAGGTSALATGFREGLRQLGWVEGRDYTIEYRTADGKVERLPALAADLARLKVDVIVALGTAAPAAARKVTTAIPIVMTFGGDPVATGLVASLARPGGNVTGLASMYPELSAKRLELLKHALPTLRGVAVLWNRDNSSHGPALRASEGAARTLGVELHSVEFRTREDFEAAFLAAKQAQVGALLILDDPATFTHRDTLVRLASNAGLPVIYPYREAAEAGGLIAFGANLPDLSRRAAGYVDKILKGAKPSELPVQQPMMFDLLINVTTAKALGVAIPPSLLLRADQVIE
jgi:putative ABC transport system substrate-binding protein